ncbi:kinase-like domain-containing protein [Rhizophagus irregularis DAOM 181602=DAOM 197198]|nr:kinase-like domain-containing protein [Rhizophagus irregularis DAOM 181602=DAOM 197198]
MAAIRKKLIYAIIQEAFSEANKNPNLNFDLTNQQKLLDEIIFANKSLTKNEKAETYLTEDTSEIYTAKWTDGPYDKWDSKKQQLKRFGMLRVILKKLENDEDANISWLEKAKSHLVISNKFSGVVKCFGLTINPEGYYMLVLQQMDINLKEYIQQNHNKITWKERIDIICDIIKSLYEIHKEKAIHRNLHSRHILYLQSANLWCISGLGFCGPADKSPEYIYGNLPYMAPELINGKAYNFASDIYSIGMLMWEISSGKPPFEDYDHDYGLAMKITNGIRPKMIPEIPLEYKQLIEQCWCADPSKRPDIDYLHNKIFEIRNLYCQNENSVDSLINEAKKYSYSNYTRNSNKEVALKYLHNSGNSTDFLTKVKKYSAKIFGRAIPIWKDGPLEYDADKKIYTNGDPNRVIALKCLHDSQNITDKFLNEVKEYSINKRSNILNVEYIIFK